MLTSWIILASCGGGGGGGSKSVAPAPVSNTVQATVTAQSLPPQTSNNAAILNCPTTSNYSVASPPNAVAGTINGRVSFERVPFSSTYGAGLDYNAMRTEPARGVVVELLAGSTGDACIGDVLQATLTDGDGWYEFTPASAAQNVCVRARAQLYRVVDGLSSASWNIVVADNTDADKLYLLSETVAAGANARPRRDLHAPAGWSNGAYQGARAAAPFAILDTACKAMNAVVATKPDAQFGALKYFWSTKNTSDDNGTLEQGKINGPFFSPDASAIYLRGDAAIDTDEFDEMVIAHEFAHFVTQRFSRSDSIGGDHGLFDSQDPRLAFDEGWATAFAGLVLNTAYYRDSNQVTGSNFLSREYYFDLQRHYGPSVPVGWYSEATVQRALFNIGADNGSFGGLGLGVQGLLQTFAGAYKTTPALASIFSFASQLKSEQPGGVANDIAQILNGEAINGDTIQAFAATETNADRPEDLPVYQSISLASPQRTVCSDNVWGTHNMLSNRRYLRFDAGIGSKYSFNVQPLGSYPQAVAGFELFNRGRALAYVVGAPGRGGARSASYITPTPLAAGSYVLSVFHVGNVVEDSAIAAGEQCFKITVAQVF